jgi:hypothetical protein
MFYRCRTPDDRRVMMIDQGLYTAVVTFVAVLVVVGVAALMAVTADAVRGPLTAWQERRADARNLQGITRATDAHEGRKASGFSGSTAAAH